MKKYLSLGVLLIIAAGAGLLFNPNLMRMVGAQTGSTLTNLNQWFTSGNYVSPKGTLIPSSTTYCLSSDCRTAWPAGGPGGSGDKYVTTTIFKMTTTTFELSTSSETNIGIAITSSSLPATITFNPFWKGTLADGRIASAAAWNAWLSYPAIATSSFLGVGYPAVATNTFALKTEPLFSAYPAVATSSFLASSGQNTTGTILYFNAQNVTTTRLNVLSGLSLPNGSVLDAMLASTFLKTESDPIFSAYPAVATSSFLGVGYPATATNTFALKTEPLFSAYPAIATSSFLGVGYPATATSTFLNASIFNAYPAIATSSFLPISYPSIATSSFLPITYPSVATSSFLGVGYPSTATSSFLASSGANVTGTINYLNVINATGTLAKFTTSSFTTANIGTANITTLNLVNALPANKITEADPIFAAYPAIATSSFLGVGYPAVATSSFLSVSYPALATSTFLSLSGGTLTGGLTFTNATGTNLKVGGILTVSSSIRDYFGGLGTQGQVLAVSSTGVQWMSTSSLGITGGSGATQFIQLTDVPASYAGQGNKCVAVNGAANALEFVTCGSGGLGLGVQTSTTGYFAYYQSNTSVTGTPYLQITNDYLQLGTSTPSMWIDSTGYVGIGMGTTTPSSTLDVMGTSTFRGRIRFNTSSTDTDTLMVKALTATDDIGDFYDYSGNSVFKIQQTEGLRIEPNFGLFWGATTAASTTNPGVRGLYDLAMMNGRIQVANSPLPNQTSTVWTDVNDPDTISSLGATGYHQFYSDDITRMMSVGVTGNLLVFLRSMNFGGTAQLYYGVRNQQITSTNFVGNNGLARGGVTYQGYHYVLMASTTQVSLTDVVRTTSSPNIDFSLKSNWSTSTWSGARPTVGATYPFLIGAANGRLYVASSTTDIIPLLINTSTNSLTVETKIVISGANILINNTRVNENGIYAGFNAAPFVRKYTFAGTAVGGILNPYRLVPVATIGEIFATKNSFYGNMHGAIVPANGTTIIMAKMQGY